MISPEAAKDILEWAFDQADKERMRALAAKARSGTLTAEEDAEAGRHELVGHLLNIMQSKARRSLQARSRRKREGDATDALIAMDRTLQELVWRRAGRRCEYCQAHQHHDRLPFEVDHVLGESHQGPAKSINYCLCCFAHSQHGERLRGRS